MDMTLAAASMISILLSSSAPPTDANAGTWSLELHQIGLFVLPPDAKVGLVPLISNFPSLLAGYFVSEEWQIAAIADWLHGVYSDERHLVQLGMRLEAQCHFYGGPQWSSYAIGGGGAAIESEHNHVNGLHNLKTYLIPRLNFGAGTRLFSGPVTVGIEVRIVAFQRIGDDTDRSRTQVAPQLDLFGGVRF